MFGQRYFGKRYFGATYFGPQLKDPLSGATSLDFANLGNIAGSKGVINGASTLTFTQSAVGIGLGQTTGATTLTFTQAGVLLGSGILKGTTTLDFTLSATTSDIVLKGATNLTFTTAAIPRGLGTLRGASALSFTATGTRMAFAYMEAFEQIEFNLEANLGATAFKTGTTSVTFDVSGFASGLVEYSGLSEFGFTVAGNLTGLRSPYKYTTNGVGKIIYEETP